MKVKNIIHHPGTHFVLCVLGYVAVMGIIAENQPWGRGWFHDLGYYIESRGESFTIPDKDSPEMKELQRKIDAWLPQILEQYPGFKVEYKKVADDQNGFLKIIEWQEEFDSDEKKAEHLAIPKHIDVIYDLLNTPKENEDADEVTKEQIQSVEAYLKSNQDILDRAIAIGLLPDQSIAGISPERYYIVAIAFNKNISDILKLKALLETRHGDFDAAFQTLKALQGWANHHVDVGTPSLISATLSTAIHLGVVGVVYSHILPLLPEKDTDFAKWDELIINENNIQEKWSHMWRGEWHSVHGHMVKLAIIEINPRDPIALLTAYTSALDDLSKPKTLRASEIKNPLAPNHLTRKSRLTFEILTLSLAAYGKGYLRSQSIFKQYNLAMTLRKLEAEGLDLKTLDKKTLDALPTQILPGIDLIIDFDEREINAPTGKIPRTPTVAF